MKTVRDILDELANDAVWCLPTVRGAVPLDRDKLNKHVKEAEEAMNNLLSIYDINYTDSSLTISSDPRIAYNQGLIWATEHMIKKGYRKDA